MNFKKVAAGILACTMSMSMFGCELVTVNKERDNAQVIISVSDKTYNKELINGVTNTVLSMYGIEDFGSEEYDEFRVEMADSFASQKAFQYYAIQNGYMDKLTDEDKKEIDEMYEETRKYYEEDLYNEVKTEMGYTDEEGAPAFDENAQARVDKKVEARRKEYLLSLGSTSLEEYKNDLTEQKAADLYTEHLKSTVTVSDNEISNYYNSLLTEQRTSFDADPSAYMDEVSAGGTVVYAPSGLRRVKHVLIKFDDETSEKLTFLGTEIASLSDGEEKTNKQSEYDILLQEALSKIQPKANEVLTKAKNGEDFDKLISEYGEDEGTETNPDGYVMHASAANAYEEEFQTAGMALGKVGDISELVQTAYGYHILLYASDIPAGEAGFDNVKDKLREEALTEKQDKAVTEKTTEIYDTYKANGTVRLFFDRLETASVPGK